MVFKIYLVLFYLFFHALCTSAEFPLEEKNLAMLLEKLENENYTMDLGLNFDIRSKNAKVDCTALGGVVAKIMEWFFKMGEKTPADLPHMKFSLYTRRVNRPVLISLDSNFNLRNTDFKIQRKTVIIVHGFLTTDSDIWTLTMKNAYLEYEDVNILIVDWSKYSFTWNYYKAVMNALSVGEQIAQFVNQTTNAHRGNKKWGKIHLIGHSLGSHICGLAADKINDAHHDWKISRITGLDPAQPCFVGSELSLSKNDAPFVDIIHTNGKQIAGIALGVVDDLGHVDFYMNGGHRQPGCETTPLLYLQSLRTIFDTIKEAICSHQRSYDYFTESLYVAARKSRFKFWGHSWNGSYNSAVEKVGEYCTRRICNEMGIHSDQYPHRGKFFVATASHAPYYAPLTPSDTKAVLKQLNRDHRTRMLSINNIMIVNIT